MASWQPPSQVGQAAAVGGRGEVVPPRTACCQPATTAHPGQAVGSQRLGGIQASPLTHQDLLSPGDARQLRQRLLHRVHPAAPRWPAGRQRAPAAAGDACALPSPRAHPQQLKAAGAAARLSKGSTQRSPGLGADLQLHRLARVRNKHLKRPHLWPSCSPPRNSRRCGPRKKPRSLQRRPRAAGRGGPKRNFELDRAVAA